MLSGKFKSQEERYSITAFIKRLKHTEQMHLHFPDEAQRSGACCPKSPARVRVGPEALLQRTFVPLE